MNVDTPTLSTPIAQGVRLVALGFLDDAHAAGEGLTSAPDPHALHDFRVAIRRLRSWLRAFDAELGDVVKKKDRRRLRDIAHATNVGRDVDVQLVWLKEAAKGFRRARRHAAEWLMQQLESRQRKGGDQVDAALVDSFEQARSGLVGSLSIYEQHVHAPDAALPTLASAIATRVMPHAEALAGKLAAVRTADDEVEAHQARIAAKRLRYLIEPAVHSVDKGDRILTSLKSLQDELGTLHDAHVMAHELRHVSLLPDAPHDGLLALGQRLHSDASAAFDQVHDHWLDGRAARFHRDLQKFADRLAELHA